MGKIKQGILGGFSGKVANIIGGSWKGIAYMRSQPLSVANPRTAGQVAQRSKFSFTVLIAQQLLATIIKPLWDRFAQGKSGYNAFVGANVAYLSDWATAEWDKAVMSVGKMIAVIPFIRNFDAATDSFDVAWDVELKDSFSLDNDNVSIVIVNVTQEKINSYSNVATRADGDYTVVVDYDLLDTDDIRIYLSFSRTDGTIVSNSGYYMIPPA